MRLKGIRTGILAGFVWAAAGAFLPSFDALAQTPNSSSENGEETGSETIGSDEFQTPFESIEVQTLSQLSTGDIGLIGVENGGLAPGAWKGSDRLVVEALLPRLPSFNGSPVISDLQRRLLLSRLTPPQGATNAGSSLFGARLDRLAAMGQLGAVEPMAQQSLGEADAPSVIGARVDALFLQARNEEACGLAASVQGKVSSSEWIKRITTCDALAGNIGAARLGVDLLRETGDADHAFIALVSQLVDELEADLSGFSDPSAVHLALFRATAAPVPDGVVARSGGGFATALAAWDGLPIAQRIAAAERAVAMGALPPGALRSLYGQSEFSEEQLTAEKVNANGPLGAALGFQKALASAESVEQAILYAKMLKDARRRGVMPAVAWALRNELTTIATTDLEAEVLFELGLGEIAAGEPAGARRWVDALVAVGPGGSDMASQLMGILAARGFAGEAGWSADALADRIQSVPAGPGRDHAILEYALLRALGIADNDRAFRASLSGTMAPFGAVPAPVVLEGLINASSAGRTAETLMFLLVALGDAGLNAAHPATLVSAIGALRQAGFEPEARALAAEALIVRAP